MNVTHVGLLYVNPSATRGSTNLTRDLFRFYARLFADIHGVLYMRLEQVRGASIAASTVVLYDDAGAVRQLGTRLSLTFWTHTRKQIFRVILVTSGAGGAT